MDNHIIKYLISILMVLLLPMIVYAEKPLLVLDRENQVTLPVKFRASSDAIKVPGINVLGFANLHAAASAQFNEAALPEILKYLKTKKLHVIDLRLESHGFLNGMSISWYGKYNASNAKKSSQQVEEIENNLLSNLAKQSIATVYQITAKDDGVIKATLPLQFNVKEVLTEKEVVEKAQLDYKRFYIQDFHAPSPAEVARFIAFVKTIPDNEWVYFHCRGGSGRSTTFMVMYDMLKNAKLVSFEDILARNSAIGGKDLTKLPNQDSFKYKFAVARLAFLKSFYQFSKKHEY